MPRESASAPPACGVGQAGGAERAPGPSGWLRLFLGRQVLRLCAKGSAVEICDGCGLRPLCKCANDQLEEAAAIERRVWAVLAVSGAAVILCAAVSFLRHS